MVGATRCYTVVTIQEVEMHAMTDNENLETILLCLIQQKDWQSSNLDELPSIYSHHNGRNPPDMNPPTKPSRPWWCVDNKVFKQSFLLYFKTLANVGAMLQNIHIISTNPLKKEQMLNPLETEDKMRNGLGNWLKDKNFKQAGVG